MRVEEGFQQPPYDEPHPYVGDPVLPSLLRRLLPQTILSAVAADLICFGDRVTNELRPLCEHATPPILIQYDQFGRRVDKLQTCGAWRQLKAITQSEGLVAIQYERKSGAYSRIHSFAKQILMVGDCQVVLCPFSMTDGAARVLELTGSSKMKEEILSKLISRDPSSAFTAGQWMTERPGGSDVSQTETTASPAPNSTTSPDMTGSEYIIDGFKWFSSATDSDIALALARTGPASQGSRSLSLFLIPLRLPLTPSPTHEHEISNNNNIFIHRLKRKFGMQILPTAELSINGAEAYLLGPLNGGVKAISSVLNVTRMHCAADSIGSLRRGLAIAQAYARVRRIDGGKRTLREAPLHMAEIAKISLIYRALTHLFFGAVTLLGRVECKVANGDEVRRLRLLTPTLKAFCSEKAVAALEECMACLGGLGYMEETGIGRLIRDSLVEKIWEGTSTVLSLDLGRAARSEGAIPAYMEWANSVIAAVPPELAESLFTPLTHLKSTLVTVPSLFPSPRKSQSKNNRFELLPRPALNLFAQITTALYLLEHAAWSYSNRSTEPDHKVDAAIFERWVEEGGLREAEDAVRMASLAGTERICMDDRIVYGSTNSEVKSKL